MEKLVDRFQAVDEDGNKYEIEIHQEIRVVRHQHGSAEIPGGRRATTSTGLALRTRDGQTFQVVNTGQILRKI